MKRKSEWEIGTIVIIREKHGTRSHTKLCISDVDEESDKSDSVMIYLPEMEEKTVLNGLWREFRENVLHLNILNNER